MSTDNIDRIKVWTTDKNQEPADANLAISRKVSAAELNNPITVDVWADFITDGVPKKKVGFVTFSYKDQPTEGEIIPSIAYSPLKVDVGMTVLLDGSGTKPSSPSAMINSWNWKVANEGGMTYPVNNADKSQASFTCPDLNWLYVTLSVGDTNNKTASKKIRIDVGEPQPPPDNHPPIAVAGEDKTVKEKTLVILDGSQSHDTDAGDTIARYQWTQSYGDPVQIINANQSIASFVAPEVGTPPPPPVKVDAKLKELIGRCKVGEYYTIDGSQSTGNITQWAIVQATSDPIQVVLEDVASPSTQKYSKRFKFPDTDNILHFTLAVSDGITSDSDSQTVAKELGGPPPGDEYNEHGTKMLYKTTGKKVTMNVGSDHRNGQRYNTNHKFQNYMQIGYFKIATNQKQIEQKTDGPNHGSCTKLPQCMWYEPDLYVDGTVRLGMEYPHPDNHAAPNSALEVDAPLKVGDLKGKWIGYSVIAYWKGDAKNGNRVIEQWVDPTPFDASGKPQNKWQLTLRAVENGQLFPKQYFPRTLPVDYDQGLESEIRMHCGEKSVGADMKWSYVYEIVPPATTTTTTTTTLEDDDDNSFLGKSLTKAELELADTKSLGFNLTVTDTKGASNSDGIIVTVTKETEPPVERCPTGQCRDTTTQQCRPLRANEVVDVNGYCKYQEPPPPPVETIKIGHIGDTHGRTSGVNGIKNLVTREKVDFLLHSGDTTDDESDASPYVDLVTNTLGLKYGINLANSQGNHESPEEGGEGAQKDIEDAFPILKQNKWLQYYHVKNVIIITGNTQLPNYSQINSEASKHIQDSLVKAKAALDNGTADWVFFMQHKPMYILANSSHEAEYNFRYVFHKLFDQYGVDFYLDGHVHIEQRTLPLIFGGDGTNVPPKVNAAMKNGAHDFTIKPHGVICCINGSSSKSHSLDEDTNPWTAYAADDGNAYTVFEIKGKNLVGKYIDIESGNVRHEFKVTKGGAPPPPVECPPGQHYDPVLKICVPDSPPPPTGTEFTFNVSGDFRDTPESGDNLISDKPTLIMCTGDYGIAADPDDWVNNTMKQWKDSGIPTYGALGNHDDAEDYLATGFFKNTSWSWAHKQGRIVFVAANTISENVAETDKLISAAQNDPSVDKVIVLMHESIWHPPNTSVGSDTTIEFHNSFKKYSKVKMVIAGHTHVYGRMLPIDNILYIMNGIGGQSPSSGSTSPSPNHKINGALHCAVNKDGSIRCQCVPNKDDAPAIMDTFTIGPNGELPTDGVPARPRSGSDDD